MDFSEQLQSLSKKIAQQSSMITTEEATKNAFVMPFLNRVLGYDVFDPTEVIPEFTADTGIKREKRLTMPSSRMVKFKFWLNVKIQ